MNPEAAKAGTLELLCLVLIWPSARAPDQARSLAYDLIQTA